MVLISLSATRRRISLVCVCVWVCVSQVRWCSFTVTMTTLNWFADAGCRNPAGWRRSVCTTASLKPATGQKNECNAQIKHLFHKPLYWLLINLQNTSDAAIMTCSVRSGSLALIWEKIDASECVSDCGVLTETVVRVWNTQARPWHTHTHTHTHTGALARRRATKWHTVSV